MKRAELEKLIREAVVQNLLNKQANNPANKPDPNNTPDEIMLKKVIDANPQIKTRLGAIGVISELDGFFKTLLSYTQIENVSKMTLLSSLKKGLDYMAPDKPTVTTKKLKK